MSTPRLAAPRLSSAVDPLAPEHLANPYPALRVLHDRTPVSWHPRGMWIVTPHADVSMLLRDRRFEHWRTKTGTPFAGAVAHLGGTGARDSLAARFAVPSRHALKERVLGRAAEILDALADGFDLMRGFAHPLTFTVSAELCGIPEDEIAPLTRLAGALDADVLAAVEPERLDEPRRGAALELVERLRTIVAAADSRTLLAVIRERAGGGAIGMAALLLVLYAGHRNMMNAVGNAVVALGRHPGVLAAVRQSPELLDRGVHELLRYDSPLQYVSVVARHPIILHGQRIEVGEEVLLAIGAANRDPAAFPAPDLMNLQRQPNDHLSFGVGATRCPGASTAAVELSAALTALIGAFRSFRVSEPVPWRAVPFAQRGPQALVLEDVVRA